MRWSGILVLALCLSALPGCSLPDMLFHTLGSRHYTDGTTTGDRESRYDQQVQYWRSTQPQL
jgi:hypothetical protein